MLKAVTTDPILDDISLDAPWALVETFSKLPRWKPQDVNAGADVIAGMLKSFGVPVTLHEPTLYLSIPYSAQVRVGDRVMKAKPPAYSRDCRAGLEGALVHVPAAYSRSIGTLFNKNQDPALSAAERLKGKIVISEGFAFPQKIHEFEQKGAIGVIAINPGADVHWGICTSIWGTPDLDDLPRKPGIPVVAVNNPDGQELIALAANGGRATIATEMEEGWYPQKVPVVEIKGTAEPEKFVLVHGHYDSWDVGVGDNATGDATLLELARVLWKNRRKLKRSVRIAWWPGHSTGRYAGSTWFADAFAIDLDENCVAQVNCDSPGCRWATMFKDVSWMPETEAYVQSAIKAVTGLASHGERPHRAGDYSFNNIGISSFFMLSSTMPDDLRAEKSYYTVGGCGGNIAWHTENDLIDIADQEILLRDIKVYAQAVLGVANASVPAVRLERGERRIRHNRREVPEGRRRRVRPFTRRQGREGSRQGGEEICARPQGRQGATRQGQSGDHRPRAHPGADQLHPRGALPPRSGGADPAIAGALRRRRDRRDAEGRPRLRAHATDARTEPRGGGAAPGDAHDRRRAVR